LPYLSILTGKFLRDSLRSSEDLGTLVFWLVQFLHEALSELLIDNAIVLLRSSKSFKSCLADLAIGHKDVAIPVVERSVAIRKSNNVPRGLVTLSTAKARALWTAFIRL
jgi:hypothetical protein